MPYEDEEAQALREYNRNKISHQPIPDDEEDDESICSNCRDPLNNAVSYKDSGMCYPCFYDLK